MKGTDLVGRWCQLTARDRNGTVAFWSRCRISSFDNGVLRIESTDGSGKRIVESIRVGDLKAMKLFAN